MLALVDINHGGEDRTEVDSTDEREDTLVLCTRILRILPCLWKCRIAGIAVGGVDCRYCRVVGVVGGRGIEAREVWSIWIFRG